LLRAYTSRALCTGQSIISLGKLLAVVFAQILVAAAQAKGYPLVALVIF